MGPKDDLEVLYRAHYAEADRDQLRLVLAILAGVSLVFLVFDSALLARGPSPWVLAVAVLRVILVTLAGVLGFWWLGRARPPKVTDRLLGVWLFLGVLMVLVNALSRPPAYFGHYLFEVLAVVLFYSSVPVPLGLKYTAGAFYLSAAIPIALVVKASDEALYLPNVVLALGFSTLVGVLLARRIEAYRRLSFQAHRALELASLTDPLTGLSNRRAFWAWAQGIRQPVVLLLVDLDRFKSINDRLGHETGDLVLKESSRRFAEALPGAQALARLGGEEFAAALDLPDLDQGRRAAEALRAALGASPFPGAPEALAVTASVGVCLWRPTAETLDEALARADRALYRAKAGGRDRIEAEA